MGPSAIGENIRDQVEQFNVSIFFTYLELYKFKTKIYFKKKMYVECFGVRSEILCGVKSKKLRKSKLCVCL